MSELEVNIGGELDLYDAEVQEILQILGRLQVKYGRRRATHENLVSLGNEAMEAFERLGFIATVSVWDSETLKPILPPEITIHGRVNPREFDPDRQEWEVKKQVAQDSTVKEFLKRGGTVEQDDQPQPIVEESERHGE
jgi:hypothetical protein